MIFFRVEDIYGKLNRNVNVKYVKYQLLYILMEDVKKIHIINHKNLIILLYIWHNVN